jgi:uncharacterized protein (TIGR02996 family)
MPFWIERSPTSRAACRICGRPIDVATPRIAASYRHAEGSSRNFFHIDCALEHNPDLVRRAAASVRSDAGLDRAALDQRLADALERDRNVLLRAVARVPELAADPQEPTTDALIARLERDPEDRGALLVLADHLQLRGDVRGELIAVQLALADGANGSELVARRDALVIELGVPAQIAPSPPTAVWGIGYIRRLELTSQTSITEIWKTPSLRLLRELHIDVATPYAAKSLEYLATQLPRTITRLELTGGRSVTLPAHLAAVLPRLDTIVVHAGYTDVTPIIAALDPELLPGVVELSFFVASLPFDEACEQLERGRWGGRLRRLELRGGSVGERGALALGTAFAARRLDRFDFRSTSCSPPNVRRLAGICHELIGVDGTTRHHTDTWYEHTAKPEWGRGKVIGRRDNKLEIRFERAGVKVFPADARFLRVCN